jgi:P27 family predicted phage terminase small subunit
MPRRLPAERRLLHGKPHRSTREIASLKRAAKTVKLGCPAPPHFLRPEAQKEWKRIVEMIGPARLLASTDLIMLSAWASCAADLVIAEQHLRREKPVRRDRDKIQRRSAWAMSKARAIDQIIRLSGCFGFDPTSRARLVAGHPNASSLLNGGNDDDGENDELARYLQRGRELMDEQ